MIAVFPPFVDEFDEENVEIAFMTLLAVLYGPVAQLREKVQDISKLIRVDENSYKEAQNLRLLDFKVWKNVGKRAACNDVYKLFLDFCCWVVARQSVNCCFNCNQLFNLDTVTVRREA